ncbi:MAG: NAD(P)-dependent oxidoreductase [Paenibacillaceae bacterium]|nr:NAD(P)-dependent oxidoreductase [Paenibacillaceae bacterium]
MKIAIIGANGKSGSLIAQEAKARGHEVTAIVRDARKVSGLPVVEKDAFALTAVDLQPFDVVVNAIGLWSPGEEPRHIELAQVLVEALGQAPNTRLIVVGGAGSLFVDEAKTKLLCETPEFPPQYYPTASNMARSLAVYEQSSGAKWTYVSPSAMFAPGKRTGAYRKGKDHLLVNAKGDSYISYEDYAIAIVDEIEQALHVNERFTVVAEAE